MDQNSLREGWAVVLAGALVTMAACPDFEVKRAIYFVFFGSMDSSQVLSSTTGTLISSAIHGRPNKARNCRGRCKPLTCPLFPRSHFGT
jgi:hypothetical protein